MPSLSSVNTPSWYFCHDTSLLTPSMGIMIKGMLRTWYSPRGVVTACSTISVSAQRKGQSAHNFWMLVTTSGAMSRPEMWSSSWLPWALLKAVSKPLTTMLMLLFKSGSSISVTMKVVEYWAEAERCIMPIMTAMMSFEITRFISECLFKF